MAQGSFSSQVSAWVAETKERAAAVKNESTQRIIEAMQEPGPSRASIAKAVSAGAGLGKVKAGGGRGRSKRAFGPVGRSGGSGNLPVDTGFLRASLVVSIGEALPELVDNPTDTSSKTWDIGEVKLKLSGAEIGDTVTAVYTARYARRIEYGFTGEDSLGRTYSQRGTRFVALAAQRWGQVVEQVCREAQSRAGG